MNEYPVDNHIRREVDDIFKNLEGLYISLFKNESWGIWCFECMPFLDREIYEEVYALINDRRERAFKIMEYPLTEDRTCYNFDKLPDFEVFDTFQEATYLKYTGGVAYSANNNWGMHSDADNGLLFIGIARGGANNKLLSQLDNHSNRLQIEEVCFKYEYNKKGSGVPPQKPADQ